MTQTRFCLIPRQLSFISIPNEKRETEKKKRKRRKRERKKKKDQGRNECMTETIETANIAHSLTLRQKELDPPLTFDNIHGLMV